MNILVIGGTRFVGRALVERLLEYDHNVTLFNRGMSGKNIFPDVETICGDRNTEISKIGDRQFDAVIDTCGYLPDQIEKSAEFLKDKVKKYVFISTISVYKKFLEDMDENGEKCILDKNEDPYKLSVKDVDYTNYGALKNLCEESLKKILPDNNVIIRPGMIIGPYDNSERFSRWAKAFVNNYDILVPDQENNSIQFIDVYDLADFTISLIKENKNSVYNAIGPENSATFGEIFKILKEESNSSSNVYWCSEQFLKENDLMKGFSQNFPFFVSGNENFVYSVSNKKALQNGLKLSSNKKIMKKIIDYLKNLNDFSIKSGLNIEKEKELIIKLNNKNFSENS